jgi:hypothetical protein
MNSDTMFERVFPFLISQQRVLTLSKNFQTKAQLSIVQVHIMERTLRRALENVNEANFLI